MVSLSGFYDAISVIAFITMLGMICIIGVFACILEKGKPIHVLLACTVIAVLGFSLMECFSDKADSIKYNIDNDYMYKFDTYIYDHPTEDPILILEAKDTGKRYRFSHSNSNQIIEIEV